MGARKTISLAAFRRNEDQRAEELRAELPVLLGRLVAEVPGSTMELHVDTGDDGVVRALIAVEAADQSAELIGEAAALLEPAAEIVAAEPVGDDGSIYWPLVATTRAVLGFRQDDSASTASLVWSSAGTRGVPELVELVNPYAGVGIRVRLTAGDPVGMARVHWDVDFAIVTHGTRPSLRLRAAVRAQYPGLEIATAPGGPPAVLRASIEELPAAFAVPVAGEEPIPGAYVGTAVPLPLHPSRRSSTDAGSIRIGSAFTVAGKAVPVTLTLSERLRHIHVIGRTGTGKSSLLAGVIHEVAMTGDGALVLDPHGTLVDRIVAELPASAAARTWVIRCGDVANPVPINPMSVEDSVRREIAIQDICATFQYLFDPKHTGIVGPRFHERVAMGLRALAAVYGSRASLLDVPAALGNAEFMKKAAQTSPDNRLKNWLANDSASQRSSDYGEVVAWVNSKFESFSGTAAMRAILGSGADAFDMGAVMDEGRILLVDLSKGEIGESATSLLGYLYLNEVWIGALQRKNPARPFTVIVDEAQSMISGSLTAMLSEGRKFGLSVLLAHQYLGQLDSDLLPAIDGNVATTVAFRGGGADAPALRQRFGERVDTTTLMTLPDLSAITLRTAADVTGDPYTMKVDHNERVVQRSGDEFLEFEASLVAATIAELVEPHRESTAAAAAWKSAISTFGAAPAPASSRKAPATPPPSKPKPKDDSFLDEWLAKRKKAEADRPVKVTDPNDGADDPFRPDHP
jgi:hypothetical protein